MQSSGVSVSYQKLRGLDFSVRCSTCIFFVMTVEIKLYCNKNFKSHCTYIVHRKDLTFLMKFDPVILMHSACDFYLFKQNG